MTLGVVSHTLMIVLLLLTKHPALTLTHLATYSASMSWMFSLYSPLLPKLPLALTTFHIGFSEIAATKLLQLSLTFSTLHFHLENPLFIGKRL